MDRQRQSECDSGGPDATDVQNLSTCPCWSALHHYSPGLLSPVHCSRINRRIRCSEISLRFRNFSTRSTSLRGSVVTHACASNVSCPPKHIRSIKVPFVAPSSSGTPHQSSMPPSASNRSSSVTTAIIGTSRPAILSRM